MKFEIWEKRCFPNFISLRVNASNYSWKLLGKNVQGKTVFLIDKNFLGKNVNYSAHAFKYLVLYQWYYLKNFEIVAVCSHR